MRSVFANRKLSSILNLFFYVVFTLTVVPISSQSVKNEKFELLHPQYPFVNLKLPITSCSSNSPHLHFYGLTPINNGDYKIKGTIYDLAQHQNLWNEKIEFSGMSDIPPIIVSRPIEVEVRNKQNDLIYYRIFNMFDQIRSSELASLRENKHELITLGAVSNQLNGLFFTYKRKMDLKLFYVAKSEVHNDVNEAYETCKEGITAYNSDEFDKANELLLKSITQWEAILAEADYKNKKSRINKDIADAILRNLIQILPVVDQYDKAIMYCDVHFQNVGGFAAIFSNGQRSVIEKQRWNFKAKLSNGGLSVDDFEFPNGTQKIDRSQFIYPKSSSEITLLLYGSWKLVSIKSDGNTNDSKGNDKIKYIHFKPDGTSYEQKTSNNGNVTLEPLEESRMYWKIIFHKDKYYLASAYDLAYFEKENSSLVTYFPILSLTKNNFVFGSTAIEDGDTTTSGLLSFERIFMK